MAISQRTSLGLSPRQTCPVQGVLSGTRGQGYNHNFEMVRSDSFGVDSGDVNGVFLGPGRSVTPGKIQGADIQEVAPHELLSQVGLELMEWTDPGSCGER